MEEALVHKEPTVQGPESVRSSQQWRDNNWTENDFAKSFCFLWLSIIIEFEIVVNRERNCGCQAFGVNLCRYIFDFLLRFLLFIFELNEGSSEITIKYPDYDELISKSTHRLRPRYSKSRPESESEGEGSIWYSWNFFLHKFKF